MKGSKPGKGICLFVLLLFGPHVWAQLPTPAEHFGFEPGTDRMMFTYEPLVSYLEVVSAASDKVHMEMAGFTEQGRPMYLVFVSSAENIRRLERLKEINRWLALDAIPEQEDRDQLLEEGRVFFLSALSMHAYEVSPTQVLPQVLYELIQGEGERNRSILENTVAMFIVHNPDGMNMVIENYNRYLNTPFEGSRLPGVYHQYVGHDINRDFVTLTQKENQVVSRIFTSEWFPQVLVERHEMRSQGPRFFVPPPHDPISETLDPGIWNWMRLFGSRAMSDMTEAGLAGVATNHMFDDFYIGETRTAKWKGMIAMLSEVASADLASPWYIEPGEIRPTGKGLSSNAVSINMPKPWEGGWWRLSDVMRYEHENIFSMLHTAALYRNEILRFRNDLSRREIKRGLTQPPFYYVLPADQHDRSELFALVNLLHEHGVQTYRLTEDAWLNRELLRPGDVVVPLAQPYRAFIKEVMEIQHFPARHYTPGGEMIRPYHVTSWSQTLHRGLKAIEVNSRNAELEALLEPLPQSWGCREDRKPEHNWALFSANNNESYRAAFMALSLGLRVERTTGPLELEGAEVPAGSFLIETARPFGQIEEAVMLGPLYLAEKPAENTRRLGMPRVALVKTWFHDVDGGWTRYLLDHYHIPFTLIRPADLSGTDLQGRFDVVLFSGAGSFAFMHGMYRRGSQTFPHRHYPHEYNLGMEQEGFDHLMRYLLAGGKIMAWGAATDLFSGHIVLGQGKERQAFMLPFVNVAAELQGEGLYVPGSLLRLNLLQDHPLTYGMPDEIGVMYHGHAAFRTFLPYFDVDRRVLGRFAGRDQLLSGHAENAHLLADEAALLWIRKGKGQVVLSAFHPQYRASTQASFKILFNTLLLE